MKDVVLPDTFRMPVGADGKVQMMEAGEVKWVERPLSDRELISDLYLKLAHAADKIAKLENVLEDVCFSFVMIAKREMWPVMLDDTKHFLREREKERNDKRRT